MLAGILATFEPTLIIDPPTAAEPVLRLFLVEPRAGQQSSSRPRQCRLSETLGRSHSSFDRWLVGPSPAGRGRTRPVPLGPNRVCCSGRARHILLRRSLLRNDRTPKPARRCSRREPPQSRTLAHRSSCPDGGASIAHTLRSNETHLCLQDSSDG